MICEVCLKNPACFRVLDKDKKIKSICEFCELPDATLLETLDKDEKPNVRFGRLHLVTKTRKEAPCRICEQVIPAGSSCYSQHVETEGRPFPEQSKVCVSCARPLIDSGTEVVLPKNKQGANI